MTHDLVIRNGFIADGTGEPGYEADIAIDDGLITAIGKIAAKGREEIDAKGQLVTPGFVDVHTHYDGQVTWGGELTPTLTASENELIGIAEGLKEAGKGVLQFVSDFNDPEKEAAMLRRIVEASGRPLSVSLAQSDLAPDGWRKLLGAIETAVEEGVPMRAQVCGRPVGVLLGLDLTMNPFTAHPVYQEIKDKPLPEKVAALRDPDFRARLLASKPDPDNPFVKSLLRQFGKLFVLGAVPDYEPTADRTVEAIAKERGQSNEEVALDILLEDDGQGMLYLPFLNYAQGSLDPSYEMLSSPATIPGLSDGGAHVGMICDGSFPTSMLTHWTRDRTRGERFPVEWIVKRQTADTAHWVGLHDRGLLKPGYRADLNVIDYDHLTLHRPETIHDLPAGGRRLMQRASGYTATIVAGEVIYRDGKPTGARPGRLVRGAQPVPAATKIAAE